MSGLNAESWRLRQKSDALQKEVKDLIDTVKKQEDEINRLRELAVCSSSEGTNFYYKDYAAQLEEQIKQLKEEMKRDKKEFDALVKRTKWQEKL